MNPELVSERPGQDDEEGLSEPVGDEEVLEEAGRPVAVCDVSPNPVNPPFEKADWNGLDSYDPDGFEITKYSWELVEAPAGSAATMPDGEAVRPRFEPDLAGDYVGQLIVTNDQGVRSDPCEITLESIPAQDLWVELYWSHANDDMDLHLLRGTGRINSQSDCYYANCTGGGWGGSLDWGVSGDSSDDPSLDLDDIPGTGPENINIQDPETAVTYSVAVHDYPGTVYSGANDATVNVYLDGSLVWTDTKTFTGEDDVQYFAEIDWSSGTVDSL